MLTYSTAYTIFALAAIIGEQMQEPYPRSDNLRTAVMYCPLTMTPAEWVAACSIHGINSGSARNRYREVRQMQKEFGEI